MIILNENLFMYLWWKDKRIRFLTQDSMTTVIMNSSFQPCIEFTTNMYIEMSGLFGFHLWYTLSTMRKEKNAICNLNQSSVDTTRKLVSDPTLCRVKWLMAICAKSILSDYCMTGCINIAGDAFQSMIQVTYTDWYKHYH